LREAVTRVPVIRVGSDGSEVRFDDEVTVEGSYLLVVNGNPMEKVVVSPFALREWTVGHLFCAGSISGAREIMSFDERDGRIEVEAAPSPGTEVEPPSAAWTVTPEMIHGGARWIAEAPRYNRTGGFHAAALLSVTGERLALFEDISRHNALDKAIGWGLISEMDLGRTMAIQSGRLPRDMVAKAAAAGIPLLGSVSAPTDAGIALAKEAGITLVGFIREKRMNIYSFPERIKG